MCLTPPPPTKKDQPGKSKAGSRLQDKLQASGKKIEVPYFGHVYFCKHRRAQSGTPTRHRESTSGQSPGSRSGLAARPQTPAARQPATRGPLRAATAGRGGGARKSPQSPRRAALSAADQSRRRGFTTSREGSESPTPTRRLGQAGEPPARRDERRARVPQVPISGHSLPLRDAKVPPVRRRLTSKFLGLPTQQAQAESYSRRSTPVVYYLTFPAGPCAGAGVPAAAVDFGRHPETTFLRAL